MVTGSLSLSNHTNNHRCLNISRYAPMCVSGLILRLYSSALLLLLSRQFLLQFAPRRLAVFTVFGENLAFTHILSCMASP